MKTQQQDPNAGKDFIAVLLLALAVFGFTGWYFTQADNDILVRQLAAKEAQLLAVQNGR